MFVWTAPWVYPQSKTPKSLPKVNQVETLDLQSLKHELADLVAARDTLRDQLETISQKASQTQWLLSIVLAVAGLLTLAQGVFAFFSAQNYVKQADDAVKRIEGLDSQVRSKYPMFSEIEDARRSAFSRLGDLSKRLNASKNLYDELDLLQRQEIFALENFVAIQFVTSTSQDGVISNLRLLGRLYGYRFISSNKAARSDFERSIYYLTIAVQKSNRSDISALNDLAWAFQDEDNEKARELFEESMRVSSDQQRARYNLGTILLDRQDPNKLAKARKFFEGATQVKNWELVPDEKKASNLYYNLACTYSCLSAYESDSVKQGALLELAVEWLRKASEEATIQQSVLEADLKDGDLAQLAASTKHTDELSKVSQAFQRRWDETRPR